MPAKGQKKRQYSDEEKAYALGVLAVHRANVYKAAKALDMSPRTLSHWAAARNLKLAAVAPLAELKREEMHEALDTLAWKIIAGMGYMIEDASLREAAVALAVLIDKSQLLRGKATVRTELSGVDGGAISVALGLHGVTDDELRRRLADAVGGAPPGDIPPPA